MEALASAIIPSDGTPGAREAGVVYFIDRALVTFSADDQKTYRRDLPELQKRVTELFPEVKLFSAATPDQQEAILESLDETDAAKPGSPSRQKLSSGIWGRSRSLKFFECTPSRGFLVDPESDRKGNSDGVGWAVIGRLPDHSFQPPFGYYDKNYPGWHPVAPVKDAERK